MDPTDPQVAAMAQQQQMGMINPHGVFGRAMAIDEKYLPHYSFSVAAMFNVNRASRTILKGGHSPVNFAVGEESGGIGGRLSRMKAMKSSPITMANASVFSEAASEHGPFQVAHWMNLGSEAFYHKGMGLKTADEISSSLAHKKTILADIESTAGGEKSKAVMAARKDVATYQTALDTRSTRSYRIGEKFHNAGWSDENTGRFIPGGQLGRLTAAKKMMGGPGQYIDPKNVQGLTDFFKASPAVTNPGVVGEIWDEASVARSAAVTSGKVGVGDLTRAEASQMMLASGNQVIGGYTAGLMHNDVMPHVGSEAFQKWAKYSNDALKMGGVDAENFTLKGYFKGFGNILKDNKSLAADVAETAGKTAAKEAGEAVLKNAGETIVEDVAKKSLVRYGAAGAAKFGLGLAAGPVGWAADAYMVAQTTEALAKLGVSAVKGAIKFAGDANKSFMGSLNNPMGGPLYQDTEVAATSRARGTMAIQQSKLNARSALGNEAAGLYSHFG